METNKLDKLWEHGENNAKYFKWVAEPMIQYTVTGTDDENKKTISYLSAVDMAIGAAVKKNEYLLTGAVIGVLGTALTWKISSVVKKRRKSEEIKVKLGDISGILEKSIEIEKSKLIKE